MFKQSPFVLFKWGMAQLMGPHDQESRVLACVDYLSTGVFDQSVLERRVERMFITSLLP